MVLACFEAAPDRLQGSRHAGIARLGPRFVITIGKDGIDAKLCRQRRHEIFRPAVPNDKATTTLAQPGIEFDKRRMDEADPPIIPVGQRFEQFLLEDKTAINPAGPPQCLSKRSMIVIAQIPPPPDKRTVKHHFLSLKPLRARVSHVRTSLCVYAQSD